MNYIEILSLIKSVLETKISQRKLKMKVSIGQEECNGCVKDGLKVSSSENDFEIFARFSEDEFEKNPAFALCIGMHVDVIAESILSSYGNGLLDTGIIEERMHYFENVESAVLPVLYPKKVLDLIEDVCPHSTFLDLVVCYYIFGDKLGVPIGTKLIKNKDIKEWGITEEILYQKAMENIQSCTTVKNMWDVLPVAETDKKKCFEIEKCDDQHDMYIVKYDMECMGAGAILNSGRLKELAEQINTKRLVIIPSSLHECLVIDGTLANIDNLKELIQYENETVVREKDVLSNSPYYYDVDEGYGMYSAEE